jgi:uncharacterized protein (TIGR03067 family)
MRTLWLIVVFTLAVSSTAGQDKAGTSDKDKLQGAWKVVSGVKGGKDMPAEMLKSVEMSFVGDKMVVKNNNMQAEFPFKIDATKKPKEMDITLPDGKTGTGIYELDGDTLKVAHGEVGDPRPKDFTSKEGSNVTVTVMKREKSEKK